MATSCHLWAAIKCRSCRRELEKCLPVAFDWGLKKEAYSIGDEIKWAVDENKKVLPQSLMNRRGQYNFGDFTMSEVLLFDPVVLQLEAEERVCTFCGGPFGLSGITIRNNRIQSAETFSPDDILKLLGERVPRCLPGCIKWYSDPSRREGINIWDIQEGGFYLPRMDWYDFPLVPIEETSQRRSWLDRLIARWHRS